MAPHRIHIVSGPMLVEPDVAAVRPAQLCELLLECANSRFVLAVALGVRHQDSDAPYPTWLLRARRQRPRSGRTANQFDEVTAFHWTRRPVCKSAPDAPYALTIGHGC